VQDSAIPSDLEKNIIISDPKKKNTSPVVKVDEKGEAKNAPHTRCSNDVTSLVKKKKRRIQPVLIAANDQ